MVDAGVVQVGWSQFFMLLVAAIVIGTIISKVFSLSIRLAIGVCIFVVIVGVGFFWLPDALTKILNGDMTLMETIDSVVNDFYNSGIVQSIEDGWNAIVNFFKSWFN